MLWLTGSTPIQVITKILKKDYLSFTIQTYRQSLHATFFMLGDLKVRRGVITCIIFFATESCLCQMHQSTIDPNNLRADLNNESPAKKGRFAFEVIVSMVEKPTVNKEKGSYNLQSRVMSAYDAGLNYIFSATRNLSISSGLHGVIGKRNWFSRIPPEDLKDFYSSNQPFLIEDKDIWGAIKIPLIFELTLNPQKLMSPQLKMGLNLYYSGFMTDEDFGWLMSRPDGQVVEIFSASYFAKNNYKPWLAYCAGFSELFKLKNDNILSVGLLLNISTTNFFKANYTFRIPSQPITSGTYKISGTCFGLSLQYILTSKRLKL